MTKDKDNLIWIDLEMTGLDPLNDQIIEIATLVTDKELNVIVEGPVLAIHQPMEILNNMDDWNTKQHTSSGLVDRIKQSLIDCKTAEMQTLNFLQGYVAPKKSPMCGNSICQDRRFLARLMPELEDYFHYRNLDVSSVKILAQKWYPKVAKGIKKSTQHLALSDIYDSIDELKYYRQHIFKHHN